MNQDKASPRFQSIRLRSMNRRTLRKKSALITGKVEGPLLRTTLMSDVNSPKYLNSSRHSIDSYLPVLSDKESLNGSMNSFNAQNVKLNGSFNRTMVMQNQITPQAHLSISDITESLKGREDVKSARLGRRNSISREKSNSRSNLDLDAALASQPLPLKPAAIFKQFLPNLSKFEQAEILDFAEIFYLGMNSAKVRGEIQETNYGFDDERSDYKFVQGDHIAYRYEVERILGKGSFGQVFKCFDHKTKKHMAIKIIRNEKRFHRQGKIEIKVLQHMKTHEANSQSHTIQMLDYFVFRKHICITFELLSVNLYELLKSNNFRGFSLSLVRRFIVQIIACLGFMREQKIIHCDLKPENILLKESNKSGIKVIDFGSSCFENEKVYTYIQSRFYRAPEIILGIEYTVAIDMWSLGCIAAELHSGYPLFPGESEAEQLLCIMEVKGVPPSEILEISTRKKNFFDGNVPKISQNSRGKKRIPETRSLIEKVKSQDENFLNFIERCLDWNPKTRMTPEEAFAHEFIQEGLRNYNRACKSSTISSSRGDGN